MKKNRIEVICPICNKSFELRPCEIKVGYKHCSKKCMSIAYRTLDKYKGFNASHWKGDKIKYRGIHEWLTNKFGKPNKCEICGVTKLLQGRFEWAKLKNKNYQRKRENFWMLCSKCHRKYDMKLETRIKISNTLKLRNRS